mmetsp:Transcript_26071/g.59946  ORF Transcript_26071/g.59946 Transcript_26071/m.59946 type:complete len:118 (+) Transcript_26071:530-883(+)
MGTYDPISGGRPDDENQTGNIIDALIKFPAPYSFTVVGKTGDSHVGEKHIKDKRSSFVDDIVHVIRDRTGEEQLVTRVTPRGKNFTKVVVDVTVYSSAMIEDIYNALSGIENVVMKF